MQLFPLEHQHSNMKKFLIIEDRKLNEKYVDDCTSRHSESSFSILNCSWVCCWLVSLFSNFDPHTSLIFSYHYNTQLLLGWIIPQNPTVSSLGGVLWESLLLPLQPWHHCYFWHSCLTHLWCILLWWSGSAGGWNQAYHWWVMHIIKREGIAKGLI